MAKPLDLRRAGLLAVLALLHLGLAFLMLHQLRGQATGAAPARKSISVSLFLDSPTPVKTSQPSPSAAKPPSARRPQAPQSIQPRKQELPEQPSPAPAVSSLATSLPAASAPQETAAPPTGSILDSEATRRALRMAAKAPLLSERAAGAMGEDFVSADQKLAQEMKKAGHGDCLKGEFAGGGMGLLSAPFWLLAEARGKCSK
ncbi:hypothetical protein DBR47_00515 [Paucibacter sp. KBW04]|uniref:hypothetical protein n=1 Tax=Paucibacter sp. KBW04 TaxID=2153361 RepID=UPI000F56C985|nr:hypothetical protein [Paucibacter sp. KBW04]RQO63090.1 hypothetical protein DBR47_00515 [Paucibacter sp. KBW04]